MTFKGDSSSLADLVSLAVTEIATKSGCEDRNEKPKENQEFISYAKQMEDKRWYAFREYVFEVRGRRCEMCGAQHNLQVHHPIYKDRYAWDYSYHEVMVLCCNCHRKMHGLPTINDI